ncbi:hypothetical protein BZA05DRAFT_240456 [Tricharina praecox]|uniref:uncharacterized protein n=1 Tax=Tricharina praecox TaxID=43433 RepID=UPI002220D138|nr:uncharacterized protein BZA05DRAFT_240456 [Tricharina praecox]KAI5855465.1 hypothetical protein BZA05DRAFT_240456 [Tricharina praecox]
MDSKEFRKIELQSPEDLRYLLSQITEVARSNIDQHLPSGAVSATDPLRQRVEEEVLQFITRTFTLAQPSISVNGLPSLSPSAYTAAEPVDEYEAFDGRLHTRVAELTAQVEQRTLQNANFRRVVPKAVVGAYEHAIDGEERSAARLRRGWEAKLAEVEGAGGDGEGAGLVRDVDRREEVESTRRRATEALQRLKGTVPEVGGRLEKAVLAADYVIEKREREEQAARERREKMPVEE